MSYCFTPNRRAMGEVDDELLEQPPQYEAAVETISKGREVTLHVFPVVERIETSGERRLRVGKGGVETAERRQIVRLETCDDGCSPETAGLDYDGTASQPVFVDARARPTAGFCSKNDRLQGESDRDRQLRTPTAAPAGKPDRRDKLNPGIKELVSADTSQLAAKTGSVEPNTDRKLSSRLLRCHLAIVIVRQRPGRGAATPKRCFCAGRHSRLRLQDQLGREKPDHRRQLPLLRRAALGHRLVPAAVAPKKLALSMPDDVMPFGATHGSLKPFGRRACLTFSTRCTSRRSRLGALATTDTTGIERGFGAC